MKKLISLIFLIAFLISSMVSCNSKPNPTQNTTEATTEIKGLSGIPDSAWRMVSSSGPNGPTDTVQWLVTYKAYHPDTKVRYTYNYGTDSATVAALKAGMANGTIDSIFVHDQGTQVDFFKRQD